MEMETGQPTDAAAVEKQQHVHTMRVRAAVKERRRASFKPVTTEKKAPCKQEAHAKKAAGQRTQKINQSRGIGQQKEPTSLSDKEDEISSLPEDVDGSGKQIFIGGLPYTWKEEEISDLMRRYGTITVLDLARNADGSSKGFAFMVYQEEDAHEHAIAGLHQKASLPGGRGLLMVKLDDRKQSNKRDANGVQSQMDCP